MGVDLVNNEPIMSSTVDLSVIFASIPYAISAFIDVMGAIFNIFDNIVFFGFTLLQFILAWYIFASLLEIWFEVSIWNIFGSEDFEDDFGGDILDD